MYSPLVSWRIKNFRNIGDVTIDFTQSPIVVVKGENEAGKTSVVKTFEVLGYNSDVRSQKEFIRDGTNGFGIAAVFADNKKIIRMKTNSANIYQVLEGDKVIWETSKLDTSEVPPEVKKIMGLIIEDETKEPLHVRTYENQLLFVLTKPSENYKVMYNALKVDNLTRAIKDGSTEANNIRSIIKSNEISIETLTNNIRGIKILDIEPAVRIKERLKAEIKQIDLLEKAEALIERNKELERQLGALAELKDVEEISISEATKIAQFYTIQNRLDELIKNRERYKDLETLESIDLSIDSKIDVVMGYIDKNRELQRVQEKYEEIKEIEEINITQIINIDKCLTLINKNKELEKQNEIYRVEGIDLIDDKEINRIRDIEKVITLLEINKQKEKEVTEYDEKMHELQHKIREAGAIVGTCPNCKTDVIMEVAH